MMFEYGKIMFCWSIEVLNDTTKFKHYIEYSLQKDAALIKFLGLSEYESVKQNLFMFSRNKQTLLF